MKHGTAIPPNASQLGAMRELTAALHARGGPRGACSATAAELLPSENVEAVAGVLDRRACLGSFD